MRLLAVVLLVLPLGRLVAQPVPAPSGWTATQGGANWIYTPANVPSGRALTVTIEPVGRLGGQDLDRWFIARAEADAARRGTLAGTITTRHDASGARVAQASYRDGQGQQWVALYTATSRASDEVRFSSMVTNLPAQAAMDYARTAGTIMAHAAVAGTNAPPPTASTPSATTNAPPVAMGSADVTILHEGRGQSTASGFAYVESADLLLNDGWAYLGLTVPPELLDVAASKRQESPKWHRWKQVGSDVFVQDGASAQWTKLTADRARPLPSGSAMHLSVIHRSATGFGGMGSYNTSGRITFLPNGRFERSSGVIAGTGAVQAGGGFVGGASSYQNQNGRASASSGSNGRVTATTTSHERGDANASGTYKVSGYTLELDGDGGLVQRVLAFYPFGDNDRLYIDRVTYNRDGR
jgi:hypothetical protein